MSDCSDCRRSFLEECVKDLMNDLKTRCNSSYSLSLGNFLLAMELFFENFFSKNPGKIVIIQALTEFVKMYHEIKFYIEEELVKTVNFMVDQQSSVLGLLEDTVLNKIKREGLKIALSEKIVTFFQTNDIDSKKILLELKKFFAEAEFEISEEDISITCPSISDCERYGYPTGAGSGAGAGAGSSEECQLFRKICYHLVLSDEYKQKKKLSREMIKITEGVYKFLTSEFSGRALTDAKKLLMKLKNDIKIKILLGKSESANITTQDLFDFFMLDRTKIIHVIDVLESKGV